MAKQYMVKANGGIVLQAADGNARKGFVLMSATECVEYEEWAKELRAAQEAGVQPVDCPKRPLFGPNRAALEAVRDAEAITITDYETDVSEAEPVYGLPAEPEPELPAAVEALLNGTDDN